ncbi:unnamed protein product [Cochlearia groenlandica]
MYQKASLLDQQYLQGIQDQQRLLFGETLGYDQINTISSGGSSLCKFQQDSDYLGSPTMTTNSEKSEVTEASTGEFCFQGRFQQFQPRYQFPQLQRQDQFRQQNFFNPHSSIVQKIGNNSGQFPTPLYEMPINDSSQGYINWGQRDASSVQQGTINRTMFSQQHDISLYGTRGNMIPQPPIQAMYQEPGSLAARPPSGQFHNSMMQLPDINNAFLKSQYDLSPANLSLQEGMSEAGSVHGLNNEVLCGNLDMGSSQRFDTSSKVVSSFQQKDTELSQSLVPLDPLEEKILFDLEDSSMSNSFPSMQSGSWSALMQTALSEASSSNTGLQEEFSSLTYQNMELSADINDISNFMDSDEQHAGCINNNTLQDSGSLNSSFPGFQLPSDQLRPCIFKDEYTLDSTQKSSKLSGHWVDSNSQQMISGGNQQVQSNVSFDNLSTANMYLQSSGMLNQLQSQTCNQSSTRGDSSASHLAGMSSFDPSQGGQVPGLVRKVGAFPHFTQHNDPATVYASQIQTINPFVASQPDNTTFPGTYSDSGFGDHTSSQTRSPQHGTNHQFNVWMDLPTHQHTSDQELLKAPLNSTSGSHVKAWQKAVQMSFPSYNMPQRVRLPQEQGAAAKNVFVFNASNKDANKLQGQTNMGFGTCSKLYEQSNGLKMSMGSGTSSISLLKPFAFNDPKMEQTFCSTGQQPSGSNDIANGMEQNHLNLPASAPVWFKQTGALRDDQRQPALYSEETPSQLTQYSKPLKTVNKTEIITPEKHKLMRRKQMAWHEQVSNASQKDHTISRAEQEWARVSKLLVEKAEYDTQTFEFALPLHRSKRRLVLTSQLMQQLFDPPHSFIMFSAASSSYSSLLFFVGRETLGDACSLTHKRENELPSLSHEVEKIPEKNKNFEKRDLQHYEVAKRLTEKAKTIGESFNRLEKTLPLPDIRCEIADLERFSVINRFARFHSKGPVANNHGSSQLKPIPQRYVTVRPMPQSLPDGVHCLSL